VYLARLLGDALHSRVQANPEKKITQSIGDEGNRRRGKYIIRQHHSWKPLEKDAPVIYLYRDPRDVAVSIMFYWGIKSLDKLFSHSGKAPKPLHPTLGWVTMMDSWGNTYREHVDVYVSYELILDYPSYGLKKIFEAILPPDDMPSDKKLKQAIKRQSFDARRAEISDAPPSKYPYGQTVQLKHMRKGIIGDWRNHFRRRHAKKVHKAWWPWLKLLGYETDESWWKKVRR
jgi:hypothetical protein